MDASEETFIPEEMGPTLPVPGPLYPKDVIDRLLFVDEFKGLEGHPDKALEEFVDSIVSPELSLTHILSPEDLYHFRLMVSNLIEMWDMTRPPYANTFESDLLTEKARFRSEAKLRRSFGMDRERVLLAPNPMTPGIMQDPASQQPNIWDRFFGGGQKRGI